jgi:hypothetical protein
MAVADALADTRSAGRHTDAAAAVELPHQTVRWKGSSYWTKLERFSTCRTTS